MRRRAASCSDPLPAVLCDGPQNWFGLVGEEYCHYTNIDVSVENGVRIAVFWVETPNIFGGYRRFGGMCCIHLDV
jgi:hypothetical protein